MRWAYLGRRITSRMRSLTERQARPCDSRWVLVRERDGRVWAGPHRWQGITFTEAERFWYQVRQRRKRERCHYRERVCRCDSKADNLNRGKATI
jgi:hypothetical protein